MKHLWSRMLMTRLKNTVWCVSSEALLIGLKFRNETTIIRSWEGGKINTLVTLALEIIDVVETLGLVPHIQTWHLRKDRKTQQLSEYPDYSTLALLLTWLLFNLYISTIHCSCIALHCTQTLLKWRSLQTSYTIKEDYQYPLIIATRCLH